MVYIILLETMIKDIMKAAVIENNKIIEKDAFYSDDTILTMAIADEIGGDHTFIFTYVWRRSPMDIADELKLSRKEFEKNLEEKEKQASDFWYYCDHLF